MRMEKKKSKEEKEFWRRHAEAKALAAEFGKEASALRKLAKRLAAKSAKAAEYLDSLGWEDKGGVEVRRFGIASAAAECDLDSWSRIPESLESLLEDV